ncbi:MAG: tRNA pseudouridine(38-40) synthase TruA [Elusimicrobiota bacterium]
MYIKAIVEYNGRDFSGFQIQKGENTIQGEIENSLKRLFKSEIRISYASRTDSGVHARGQVISFRTPFDLHYDKIRRALNDLLDENIIITHISESDPEFHPRYHAKSKTYRYRILSQPENDYSLKDFVWHLPKPVDWNKVENGLNLCSGEHEFIYFSTGCENKRTCIDIIRTSISKSGNMHDIVFEAKYFLTHMIRYIVGYLIAVGRGQETLEDLEEMLEGKGKECIYCAPPQGLELVKVCY